MTTPSDKPGNSSFSTFGLGVAFGIAAAFLFGTEEGRKIVKKTFDKLPDKYKNPIESSLRGGTPTWQSHSTPVPVITPEETQHHAVFDPADPFTHSTESPPPPAPHIRPTRPEPFTPTT